MSPDSAFALGLFIAIASSALTVFSIFFNYDEETPVKVSKWGWIAVLATLLLLIGNAVVKYADYNETLNKQAAAQKREAKASRFTETLLKKNDTLTALISELKTITSTSFSSIEKDLQGNVTNLSKVNESMHSVWDSMTDMSYPIENVSLSAHFEMGSVYELFETSIIETVKLQHGDSSEYILRRMIGDFKNIHGFEPWSPHSIKIKTILGNRYVKVFSSDTLIIETVVEHPDIVNVVYSSMINENAICKSIRCLTEMPLNITIEYDYVRFYERIIDWTFEFDSTSSYGVLDRDFYYQNQEIFETAFGSNLYIPKLAYLQLNVMTPEQHSVVIEDIDRHGVYEYYDSFSNNYVLSIEINLNDRELISLISDRKVGI